MLRSSSSFLLYFIAFVSFQILASHQVAVVVLVNASSFVIAGHATLSLSHRQVNVYKRDHYLKHYIDNQLITSTGANRQQRVLHQLQLRASNSHGNNSNDDTISEIFSLIIDKESILNLEQNDNEKNGTLEFSKSLLIEGTVIGKLHCTYYYDNKSDFAGSTFLKIGDDGELRGNVENCVMSVDILGKLVGDVHCDKLYVGKKAVLIGNVKARSM